MFKTLWVTTLLTAVLAVAASATFAAATSTDTGVDLEPLPETANLAIETPQSTSEITLSAETERMLTCPSFDNARYPEVAACPHFPIMCHGGCKRGGYDSGYCNGQKCMCFNWFRPGSNQGERATGAESDSTGHEQFAPGVTFGSKDFS
ncbi:hypothetical protein [Natronoglycomyces albus]|uniref:Invertebrate defensins family profile domain-containing protein n=1 Tax=Natronoglycomyces albus TaxID=2811108 RepID=A0A895XY81_9ACTN|nr:hypothetical protein [Natronoglycomyces albus]QSB06578.1 hypothetical protein JQS30_06665 [Natronoglycomyces albus]